MKQAEIPGTSIAIVQNDEVIYLKGFGVRELGKTEPVTPDTLFMLASGSKPLTTLMMATVVDDGLMQWETPVIELLPSFAVGDSELTRSLTMRQLVCACSGIQLNETIFFISGFPNATAMIQSLKTATPTAKPGEKYLYSNLIFSTGGYIAGHAAGGSENDLDAGYAAAMKSRVFDPAGMTRTTLSMDRVKALGDYALPHGRNLNYNYQPLPLSAENFVLSSLPAGGIWSSASDISKLMIPLMNAGAAPDGNWIVSTENLAKTWEPQIKMDEEGESYALGWMISDYQGERLVHHSGNSMGFSTELVLVPESKLGIVILTNAESASAFTTAIRQRFLELAFDQPIQYDTDLQAKVRESETRVLDFASKLDPGIDEQALAAYTGTFTNPELGTITIWIESDKLMMQTNGFSSELRRHSGQTTPTYFLSDPPLAILAFWYFRFETDANGHPMVLLYETQIPIHFAFEKQQ